MFLYYTCKRKKQIKYKKKKKNLKTSKSVSAFKFNMKRKLVKDFIAGFLNISLNYFRILKVGLYYCHLVSIVACCNYLHLSYCRL